MISSCSNGVPSDGFSFFHSILIGHWVLEWPLCSDELRKAIFCSELISLGLDQMQRSLIALWMKNVAWQISKQRMLQPSGTTATPDCEPLGNSGWRQTGWQTLSHCSQPHTCTLRGFRMEKSRILAPDSWGTYQRSDFNELRLLHLPIHRKVLNSWNRGVWLSLIISNLSLKLKNIYIYSLIYFWLCWVLLLLPRLFSSCNEQELLLVAVLRLLMVVASLVAEHKL